MRNLDAASNVRQTNYKTVEHIVFHMPNQRDAVPATRYWYVKVTPEEHDEGNEQADACERSLSNYVRWLVKRDRPRLIEAGLLIPEVKPSRRPPKKKR
jgi:hypothetical protein